MDDLSPLLDIDAEIYAEAPGKDIHAFLGTFSGGRGSSSSRASGGVEFGLSVENMLWCNTVVASEFGVVGVVVYTGM